MHALFLVVNLKNMKYTSDGNKNRIYNFVKKSFRNQSLELLNILVE